MSPYECCDEVVFHAMPEGRWVTSEDVFNRAKPDLPPGWTMRDVGYAIRRLHSRLGYPIKAEKVHANIAIFKRVSAHKEG